MKRNYLEQVHGKKIAVVGGVARELECDCN